MSSEPPVSDSRPAGLFDRLLRLGEAPLLVGVLIGLLGWALTHVVERLQETATIEFALQAATPDDTGLCAIEPDARPRSRTLRLQNLSRDSAIGGVTIDIVARSPDAGGQALIARPLCVIDDADSHTLTAAVDAAPDDPSASGRRVLLIRSMPPGAKARVVIVATTSGTVFEPLLDVHCGDDGDDCAARAITLQPLGMWTRLVRWELPLVSMLGLLAATVVALALVRLARRP